VSSSSSSSRQLRAVNRRSLRAVVCDLYAAIVLAWVAASASLQPARSGAVLLLCLAPLFMLLTVFLHPYCRRHPKPGFCSAFGLHLTIQPSAATLRC
jgi:hypothetical protein